MNNNDVHKQDLQAEVEWYDSKKFYIDSGHWTSHPLFASRVRHWLAFSHVRYPAFLKAMNLLLDWPWRILWPFKFFSAGIGWYCEKPMQ